MWGVGVLCRESAVRTTSICLASLHLFLGFSQLQTENSNTGFSVTRAHIVIAPLRACAPFGISYLVTIAAGPTAAMQSVSCCHKPCWRCCYFSSYTKNTSIGEAALAAPPPPRQNLDITTGDKRVWYHIVLAKEFWSIPLSYRRIAERRD